MRSTLLFPSLFLFLGACSSGATSPADLALAAVAIDAGGCDNPRVVASSGCGSLRWSTSTLKAPPRDHHASFIATTAAGSFLYVIGGFDQDGNASDSVMRAPLARDGTLGTFVTDSPLPVAVAGHAAALVGQTLVVAGGMRSDRSFSAPIQADGSVGAWHEGGSILHRRMHAAALARDNAVYVMGGFDTAGVWDDVVRATVSPDGTLGPFTAVGKLPGPRSHFTVNDVAGAVFLVGGFDLPAGKLPPNLKEAWRGDLQGDGSFTWTALAALPKGMAGHGSFYYGGYLYQAGGLDNDLNAMADVLRASIGADHTLANWEAAPSLPIPRGHVHQLPTKDNHVYSIAGAIDANLTTTDEIDVGTF